MSDLVVRLYNVRFGDAVLVMIPEKSGGHDVVRTILFDFGNALSEEGGVDAVFEPVIDDLKTTLGGKKLDLFVMTHEHLDHVQGFFYAKEKLKKSIKARQVWLTGSADPTYYDDHPEAKKELKAAYAAYRAAKVRLNALPEVSFFTSVLMANNDVRTTKNVHRLPADRARHAAERPLRRPDDRPQPAPAGEQRHAHAVGARGGHRRVLRQVQAARGEPADR